MLPWQRLKKKEASVIVQTRMPDAPKEESDDAALESCAEDLMSALESGDKRAVASAIRSAFQVLESEPHEEPGEIESEESPE